MSKKQFKETCDTVIEMNDDLKNFLKGRKTQNKKTNVLDMMNFGSEPEDLINVNENEDLITFNGKDLIPTAEYDLKEEDLIDFGKENEEVKIKYNLKKKEKLNSENEQNIDGNDFLYKLFKKNASKSILGLTLTKELKEEIEDLDSEASIGFANILGSIIAANSNKLACFIKDKKKIGKIVKSMFNIIGILLTPQEYNYVT